MDKKSAESVDFFVSVSYNVCTVKMMMEKMMTQVTFSSCYKYTNNPDELREAARQVRSSAAFAHGQTYQDAMGRAAELDARADELERLINEAERNGTSIHNGSIFNADCNWDSSCDSGSSDCDF